VPPQLLEHRQRRQHHSTLPRDSDLREVIDYRRSLLMAQKRADLCWAD
jgi:hypothetical protein